MGAVDHLNAQQFGSLPDLRLTDRDTVPYPGQMGRVKGLVSRARASMGGLHHSRTSPGYTELPSPGEGNTRSAPLVRALSGDSLLAVRSVRGEQRASWGRKDIPTRDIPKNVRAGWV